MIPKEIENIIPPVPAGISRPKWSVMIPVFNPDKFFIEAVNSVVDQNAGKENMQIEVVDDCSTEADVEKIVAENWKGRVEFFRNKENLGHSRNYNECLKRARGELIHFVHQDDRILPGFYKKFEDIFEKFTDIGAAYCRQAYIDGAGKLISYSYPDLETSGILDDALVKLAERQRVQHCSIVVKRSVYENAGGFFNRNIGCEDWEMWVRIAANYPIAYEVQPLAEYRIHSTSMSSKNMRTGKDMKDLREALDIFIDYLPEEKREEVKISARKHYAEYSFGNAEKLLELHDKEGASAQLSETINLNPELIFENLKTISETEYPVESAGVSVVICSHNNEDTIEKTLRHLIIQRVPDYIPWEIILIDNASNDNTVNAAKKTWEKFNGKTPFRIIEFEKTGILETRTNAIRNAKYNFVLFCYPGDLLGRNYVRYVSQNMMRDMKLGVLGAYTEPESGVEAPEWFEDWSNYCYRIGEQYEYTSDITWSRGFVWSSGMAIRKDAWEELINKNFKSNYESKYGNDEIAAAGADAELCYALRLSGWRIWYSIDLKLKRLFTARELSWERFRKIWNQYGEDSVVLNSLSHYKKKNVKDFSKLPVVQNRRKLIYNEYRKLRTFKDWKLKSYRQSLAGDRDILLIEFKFGRLKELLKDVKTYNRKMSLLRRIFRKKDFKYLKYVTGKPYFRFPQYKKRNDKRGVSVILNYEGTSHDRLLKSLEKISEQRINKDFPWEVILICGGISNDFKNQILHTWERYNCSASLKIADSSALILNSELLQKTAIEKSKFNFLIFLNENNFISPDFVRIAFKVISRNKSIGILGGQTEPVSDVNPPKWFAHYKEYYGIGKQADESSDITFTAGYLRNAGLVARKKALEEILEDNINLNLNANGHTETFSEMDLSYKIKLAGWKIYYEPRLRLKKFISVRQFSWEYLRKLSNHAGSASVKEEMLIKLLKYNNGKEAAEKKTWIENATKTLGEIRKYPLKKIFSKKDDFRGDSDVIELERHQGRFKEIIKVKEKYTELVKKVSQDLNGNGFKDLRFSGNGLHRKNEKQKGVSIVICCYNSSKVLPQTLINICTQKVTSDIPWEVIVVDNASTDDTSKTAQEVWDNHNCLAPFKIVKQPEPGLSAARQKGFDTAAYEYIIFCDDDNRLNNDFVSLVYEIMNANKDTGVLGGQSKAEFELTPSKWFKDWQNSFAVGKQASESGDITWTRGFVWGAAMVVRKEAWKQLQSGGFNSLLTDRKANMLSAGGDTEICYALRNRGWKILYDSRLKFKHYISNERLNWNYLKKLFRGFGQASAALDRYTVNAKKLSAKIPLAGKPPALKSARIELYKTLSTLRKPVYRNLLLSKKENIGNANIPMIEYCIGRLEGLIKTRGGYNRGMKLLKKTVRKHEYKLLSSFLEGNAGKFPRYKTIKKLNGVSVIICTFNGEERLPETIKYIAEQKVDKRILWELILVDNASTDNTKEAVRKEWSRHSSNAKLKIVDEFTPGLSAARQKGFDTANYEYVVLCDDDNLLDENFVQVTYDVMSSNEKIGILGGPNEPVCELEPPEWFKWFQHGYAAGVQADLISGKVSEGNITWKRGFVWGAGMILRKTALNELYSKGFLSKMSDRKGNQLSSGGDSELCFALVLSGWQVWYDKRLKLKHCMPAGRVSWNYLIRLFEGFGITSVGLDYYEKAIKLGKVDIDEKKVNALNWWHEIKKSINELRKFGIRKLLSLRFPHDNITSVPMMEFHIARLKELIRVRKEYDKNLEEIKNAQWKESYKELKRDHRKFIETENDFRYGWPWTSESFSKNVITQTGKSFPKISILSPSFNSENTIEKAILSVMNQAYPDFEHIICDGGSTDSTVEIIKKFPHIKWISEKDKGQCDAMNKAFSMSDGEIITYLNTDDYFQRDAFYKIAKAFEENPDADMTVGNLYFECYDHTYIRKPEIDYKKIMQPYKYLFPINPVSYFYRRKVQENIGPFPLDNHFAMDYWFLLRAYQNSKLVKIEDYLGTFCMNGLNKTSSTDNRKNVHQVAVQHLKNYDRKNLAFYLYNYYKFYYYERKPYNLNSLLIKMKKNLGRIFSVLSLRKNKYYSGKMFEESRSSYYLKKRFRSTSLLLSSFLIYPKGVTQRSRQSLLFYAVFGSRLSGKAKLAYYFLTTPPGLPLAGKLFYYGNEFRKNKKSLKGNSLLLLTYLMSPKYFFKGEQSRKSGRRKSFRYLNPVNWARYFVNFFRHKKYRDVSYSSFEKAGSKYYNHKNIQATMLMLKSFLIYPYSVKKKSRLNLLMYSSLGNTLGEKIKFAYHLYRDNPEYSFAHKLNYYGNELRKSRHSLKGNSVLMAAYILSPKYISKRERIKSSNIVYVSNYIDQKKRISLNPINWGKKSLRLMRRFKNGELDLSSRSRYFYEMSLFRLKSVFYYNFKYKKYRAQSKKLHLMAQENYNSNKRFNAVMLLIPSFVLYPGSIFSSKNKWSLLINSLLGRSLAKKLKRTTGK